MVTTKLQGGLGNQLFQIATALAYGLKHNMGHQIPKTVDNPHYPGQQPYIFPGISYLNEPIKPPVPVYTEPYFHYQEIPYMTNICLEGYFQSEKYFAAYRQEIFKAFGFKYHNSPEHTVAIHVRRGNYLSKPDYHPVITENYLTKAIGYFYERGYINFLVFSDDIPWCENFFSTIVVCNFTYSKGWSDVNDLVRASYCEHIIGSNSSFSWWAHYLNQNPDKIAIFPATWFGPDGPKDTNDLYPENCIRF